MLICISLFVYIEVLIMNRIAVVWLAPLLFAITLPALAMKDPRQQMEVSPQIEMMMLAQMRQHLMDINVLLTFLSQDKLDEAAEYAEKKLGMSSTGNTPLHAMQQNGEELKLPPREFQMMGQAMHKSASQFARKAEEGDLQESLVALQGITQNCVSCHAAFKLK